MALSSKSLFTYGITVTSTSNAIDFSTGGAPLQAFLSPGSYSPTGLALEVANQLQSLDSVNTYTVTVARNILGGTQNRMIISINGSTLSLLFGTGANVHTSAAFLMGYNPIDYTGFTTYTGSQSMGTGLSPSYIGYNYLTKVNMAKLFGAVNISSAGLKEAVTFNIQNFIQVEYKFEPASALPFWENFFLWSIQQKPFDFTPEISNFNTVYNVTLEQTQYEDKGLGFQMNEMLADIMPNFYQTGQLIFRIVPNLSTFIV